MNSTKRVEVKLSKDTLDKITKPIDQLREELKKHRSGEAGPAIEILYADGKPTCAVIDGEVYELRQQDPPPG